MARRKSLSTMTGSPTQLFIVETTMHEARKYLTQLAYSTVLV